MTASGATRARCPGRRRRQRGQSMVEVAVMAAVLVPLFLLVPVLAKYIHLRQANHQAARAAAWEATVSPSHATPDRLRTQAALVDRHFARAETPIRSQPPPAPRRDAPVGNLFLGTFSGQPLLETADVVVSAYRNEGRPGFLDEVTNLLERMPGEFPPNKRGYVTAEVMVSPQNLRTRNGNPAGYLAPFDALDLRMTSRHTLLTDAWNAAGPGSGGSPHERSVVSQVRTLVPTAYLGDIDPGLGSVIEKIPFVGVIGKLDLGHIAPDVVPYERLQPYAPPRP